MDKTCVTIGLKFTEKCQPALDIGIATGGRLDDHIGHQVDGFRRGVVEGRR